MRSVDVKVASASTANVTKSWNNDNSCNEQTNKQVSKRFVSVIYTVLTARGVARGGQGGQSHPSPL